MSDERLREACEKTLSLCRLANSAAGTPRPLPEWWEIEVFFAPLLDEARREEREHLAQRYEDAAPGVFVYCDDLVKAIRALPDVEPGEDAT